MVSDPIILARFKPVQRIRAMQQPQTINQVIGAIEIRPCQQLTMAQAGQRLGPKQDHKQDQCQRRPTQAMKLDAGRQKDLHGAAHLTR